MSKNRSSGILLHISSLPSSYGVGDLGSSSFKLVDLLVENGFTYWQILPLNPLGFGNSPYQAFSAFAGDPIYISPDDLVSLGLIDGEELIASPHFDRKKVDFEAVREWKELVFGLAWKRFKTQENHWIKHEYGDFLNENSWWLTDYALYMALMDNLETGDWSSWPDEFKTRKSDSLAKAKAELADAINYVQFKQFLFFKQYFGLKHYANSKGIKIFGDLPLYVSLQSSDAWANQDLFILDEDKIPSLVGGVPPDYFSADGQRWGNPVYNWDALAQQDYHWWIARLYFNLYFFDLVRIDHFRGLESFWAIPANSETAKIGEWLPAHGHQILTIMKSRMPNLPIVAEDLGIITPEVEKLRDDFELPGMKVLQFAFTSDETNEHLPHNYSQNNIVYTGTHDNNTLKGWLGDIENAEKQLASNYLNGYKGSLPDRLILLAWSSVAKMAIIPMQDILQLGYEGRMNTPGTATGNWGWRFDWKELRKERMLWFKKINHLYSR